MAFGSYLRTARPPDKGVLVDFNDMILGRVRVKKNSTQEEKDAHHGDHVSSATDPFVAVRQKEQ